jgi:dCTP deaminase
MFLARQHLEALAPVSPTGPALYNPASIDLRLSEEIWLEPRQFVLASTLETVTIDDRHIGFVCGKSSWAREGLIVESAGLVDPGFTGTIVLELYNLCDEGLWLSAELRVAQLYVGRLCGITDMPYGSPAAGSHYQGQSGVTPSWRTLKGHPWAP